MRWLAEHAFFYTIYAWAFYPAFRAFVILLIVAPWVVVIAGLFQ